MKQVLAGDVNSATFWYDQDHQGSIVEAWKTAVNAGDNGSGGAQRRVLRYDNFGSATTASGVRTATTGSMTIGAQHLYNCSSSVVQITF